MTLIVNGERRVLDLPPPNAHLQALLLALDLPLDRVAVEVNGALVRRALHPAHALRDGDVVEIVTLVGGG